jgi:hypothetical protein
MMGATSAANAQTGPYPSGTGGNGSGFGAPLPTPLPTAEALPQYLRNVGLDVQSSQRLPSGHVECTVVLNCNGWTFHLYCDQIEQTRDLWDSDHWN